MWITMALIMVNQILIRLGEPRTLWRARGLTANFRMVSPARWATAQRRRRWRTRPWSPWSTPSASPPPTAGWWTSTRWSRVKPTKPNLRQVCSPAFTCVCKEGTAYNERLGRWVILIPYITPTPPPDHIQLDIHVTWLFKLWYFSYDIYE